MKYIKKFIELSKNDAHIAGTKRTASLGEMLNANIPVPDGYVVTADTFDQFLAETDLTQELRAILDTVDTKAIHTVEHASEKIQTMIKSVEMPEDIATEVMSQFKELNAKYVAVRSSATAEDGADHAWAGQLDSYLNTTEENLLEMVQSCWASLFTPRAIFYRFEKGLHTTHISVAVVIQKMVNSEKSGIAFSVHPVTEDYNQIIIEAGLGLGEAIVSGSVTPDSYVITKEPQDIIDVNVNTQNKALYRGTAKTEHGFNEWKDLPGAEATQQVLSKEQIIELSNIIVTIENHYGFPCDIEWAFEENTFYIVQSRPITTLKPISEQVKKRVFDKHYVRDNSLLSFGIWHKNQTKLFEEVFGWNMTSFVLDATDGVTTVFYETAMFDVLEQKVVERISDAKNFEPLVEDYNSYMDYLEPIWHAENGINNRDEFLKYINYAVKGWTGMSIGYVAPNIEELPQKYKDVGMEMRLRGAEYFEDTDRIVKRSLKELYPELGELSRYLLLEEVENDMIPEISELSKRKEHFIFFEDRLFTEVDFDSWVQEHDLILNIEKPEEVGDSIKGTTAMKGKVTGKVRIIMKKSLIDTVEEGDILVTSMTTPDFMPAMNKAAAFITDEGGVTCHAAIVARELGKPCVIGTKFATQILRDGDLVEVDADNGVVKILEKKTVDLSYFDNFTFQASRPQTLQRDELVSALYEKYFNMGLRFMTLPFEGVQRAWYIDSFSESKIYTHLRERVSTREKLEKTMKEYFILCESFVKSSKKYLKKNMSKKDLLNNFNDIYDKTRQYSDHVWLPFPIEKEIDQEFITQLKTEQPNDFDEIYSAVSNLTQLTSYHQMRMEMCDGIVNEVDFEVLSQNLVKKYFWYPEYSYVEKLFNDRYFLNELESIDIKKAKSELSKLHEIQFNNKKLFDQQIKRIKNDSLKLKAKVLNTYIFIRTDRVDAFKKLMAPMRNVFDQIANYLHNDTGQKWNRNAVVELTNSEIVEYLAEDKNPDLELTLERKKHYIFTNDISGKKIIDNKEHVNKITDYVLCKKNKLNSIKGKSAFKGKVQGKAVLVFSKGDLSKVQSGNILVARTTMVEYTPTMEIAAAFITAEGGITSHAAIVARELQKPCIVGTSNCMDLLRDGDLVEVDANNGVVRILENKTEEFFDKQISLTEWLGNMNHEDSSKHRDEDNEKRERLAVLNEIIGIPFDRPMKFSLVDVINRSEEFQKYLDNHGDDKCALRLIPLDKEFKKLRMREKTVKDVTEGWLTEQNIDPEKYRADYVPHADETAWSTIFIVNEKGMRGEIIADSHEKLTQGYYNENRPISFEYDFKNWKLVPENKEAQKHLETVIEYLNISKENQESIKEQLGGTFSSGYLNGYFETVDTNQGFWFIDYNRLINQQIPDLQVSESSDLSGQCASVGNYVGTVSIITDPTDANFSEGDVLVCDMTSPKYLPLMQKAGAIVTNRGGVTCHAAIVARELGIPCIIGTEFATQKLNNGDRVKIEADNGIVKVVEKTE